MCGACLPHNYKGTFNPSRVCDECGKTAACSVVSESSLGKLREASVAAEAAMLMVAARANGLSRDELEGAFYAAFKNYG